MAGRLTLAFVAVALLAVAVLGGLTWATTQSQVSSLVKSRRAETAQEVATALADAYTAAASWRNADPRPARALAMSAGASLLVRDNSGAVLAFGHGMGGGFGPMLRRGAATALGDPQTIPVIASGRQVGTAELRFPLAASAAEQQVRKVLGRTVVWGGALAAALAIIVGLLVARGIVQPVRRIAGAARSLAAGDRSVRVGEAGPAELGRLGSAFNRMAETIEREDGLRRAFAADVAHELRTPLAIVQGELEALVDGVEEPTSERLASLQEETLRLARIVADVETLAAAESAQFRLQRERLDLADVAREAIAGLQSQAEASGLQVTTHLQPTPVEADRARLGQVVRNLLGNAIKFTPPGGSVEISAAPSDGEALLVVEDTGPGFTEDEAPHLFERFWRGRSARSTDGSGVGLAVVSELVAAHGGRIQASPRPGGGARFTVRLPCERRQG